LPRACFRLTFAMLDDEARPYSVLEDGGEFRIVDETGRAAVACRDARNADNYAVLLNEAYRRGYHAGYRRARESFRTKDGK
jgi:hypothetical protein